MAGRNDTRTTDPNLSGSHRRRRSVFVTVGTTRFDSLTTTISDHRFLRLISRPECGAYNELTVQFGRGESVPFGSTSASEGGSPGEGSEGKDHRGVRCSCYRFKPSLHADMVHADLILSHAGAGSIMEGLGVCSERARKNSSGAYSAGGKKLVVVTNSALMDDHQTELADALSSRGYLFVVSDPAELMEEQTLRRIEEFRPVDFPGGDDGADFAKLVDDLVGF